MCKYCDLKEIGDKEFVNDVNLSSIVSIKDGSHVSELYLNRYVLDSDNIHRSTLILETGVKLYDGYHTIKTKELKIKYCPFCGEKL